MDVELVGPAEIRRRWPLSELIVALGGGSARFRSSDPEMLPIAFVDPDEPERIFVRRLDETVAHRIIAHEGLHVVLLRLGEREASFKLDWLWARRRVG